MRISRRAAAGAMLGGALTAATPDGRSKEMMSAWQEMFTASQRDKKGLMFWIGGQSLGGVVVRTIGDEAVEVRNREYGKIIIRLATVDAIGAN